MYACSSVRWSARENGTNGRSSTNSSSPSPVGVLEHRVVRDETVRPSDSDASSLGACSSSPSRVVGGWAAASSPRGSTPGAWATDHAPSRSKKSAGWQLVLRVDVGLHPEQVLGVAQVLEQLGAASSSNGENRSPNAPCHAWIIGSSGR